MAEVTDIGTAISLGTNLQPDRTQPLTRASNQWLAGQMRQDALKARQKEKQDSEMNTIVGSLKGGKYDAVLNPKVKELYANTILKIKNAPSIEAKNQAKNEYDFEINRYNAIQNQRNKVNAELTKTPMPSDFVEAHQKGQTDKWIADNPQQESIEIFNGDVIVSLPKIKDVNAYEAGVFNKYANSMIEIETGKTLPTGQKQYIKSYSPQQLGQFAEEMANNRDYRERLYLDNKKQMQPLIEQGIAKGLEPLEAKREAAYKIAYDNLSVQNQRYMFKGEPPQPTSPYGKTAPLKAQEFSSEFSGDNIYNMVDSRMPEMLKRAEGTAPFPKDIKLQTFGVALPQAPRIVGSKGAIFNSITINPITRKVEVVGNNISSMNIGGMLSKSVEGEVVEVDDKDLDKVITLIAADIGIDKNLLTQTVKNARVNDERKNKVGREQLTSYLSGNKPKTQAPKSSGTKTTTSVKMSYPEWKKKNPNGTPSQFKSYINN